MRLGLASIGMHFLQKRQQTTLSSISSAQTAHRIEPVTRQREDQARLRNNSREINLSNREVLVSLWARQLEAAFGWSRSDEGRARAIHLAEPVNGKERKNRGKL